MTRPRKPFGTSHPGRLPSTMLKVLAAELTDPTRLRKGKAYGRDGSVTDIVIDEGSVVVEVQGSRSTPYVATIEVRPGDGMPLKRDLITYCTCPDDGNWDDAACKHVVAGLFVFADEVLIEPELLDIWRGNARAVTAPDSATSEPHDPTTSDTQSARVEQARRHLRLITGEDGRVATGDRSAPSTAGPRTSPADTADEPRADGGDDPLRDELAMPAGGSLPEVPVFEQLEHPRRAGRELDDLLADALRHARLEWE